jgi:hypothetical protein
MIKKKYPQSFYSTTFPINNVSRPTAGLSYPSVVYQVQQLYSDQLLWLPTLQLHRRLILRTATKSVSPPSPNQRTSRTKQIDQFFPMSEENNWVIFSSNQQREKYRISRNQVHPHLFQVRHCYQSPTLRLLHSVQELFYRVKRQYYQCLRIIYRFSGSWEKPSNQWKMCWNVFCPFSLICSCQLFSGSPLLLPMSDFGRNPLQRPIPPWPRELSCGLVHPSGHHHDTVPDPDIPFDPPIPPEPPPPPVPSVVDKQESSPTTVPEGDAALESNSENNRKTESSLSTDRGSKYWDKDLPFERCTVKLHWYHGKLISDGSHPTLHCGWWIFLSSLCFLLLWLWLASHLLLLFFVFLSFVLFYWVIPPKLRLRGSVEEVEEQSRTFAWRVQVYSCKSIMGSLKSGRDI